MGVSSAVPPFRLNSPFPSVQPWSRRSSYKFANKRRTLRRQILKNLPDLGQSPLKIINFVANYSFVCYGLLKGSKAIFRKGVLHEDQPYQLKNRKKIRDKCCFFFKSNSSLAFPELDSDVAGRLGTAEQFAVDGDRLVAHGEGHAKEGKGEHRNSQHPEISRKNQTKILSTKNETCR